MTPNGALPCAKPPTGMRPPSAWLTTPGNSMPIPIVRRTTPRCARDLPVRHSSMRATDLIARALAPSPR